MRGRRNLEAGIPMSPVIVIFGANGFLGRYLCRHFARQGREVVAVGSGGVVAPLPVEPAARRDRRVMRLRSGLAYGRADGASLENLRLSLVGLVDDQLRAAHRIDRRQDPEAARVVLGDELDAFVNDPDAAAVLLKPRSLDRILTLIERL